MQRRVCCGVLGVLIMTGVAAPDRGDAWGDLAHQVICEIAFQDLTPPARAEVRRLLGTELRPYLSSLLQRLYLGRSSPQTCDSALSKPPSNPDTRDDGRSDLPAGGRLRRDGHWRRYRRAPGCYCFRCRQTPSVKISGALDGRLASTAPYLVPRRSRRE